MPQNDVVSVEIRFLLLRLLAEISLRIPWVATFQDNEQELAALQSRTQQLETQLLDIQQQLEAEQFQAKHGETKLLAAREEIETLRARIYLLEAQNKNLQVQLVTQRQTKI